MVLIKFSELIQLHNEGKLISFLLSPNKILDSQVYVNQDLYGKVSKTTMKSFNRYIKKLDK